MQRRYTFTRIEIISAIIVALLFLFATYVSTAYKPVIENFIGSYGVWGMLLYVATAIGATVIAPVSATPLIPVATALWGVVPSALLSITGWTIGSVIAFWLSRKYGYEKISRFVRLQKIQMYAEKLPKKNIFWSVVFMRIVLPVDMLSYALGLFSSMSLRSYTVATIIGIAPFAFIFAYTAGLPLWVQGVALSIIGVLLFLSYRQIRKQINETSNEKSV